MEYEWDILQQEDHAFRYWTAGGIHFSESKHSSFFESQHF